MKKLENLLARFLGIGFLIFIIGFIIISIKHDKEVYKYPGFTKATITGYIYNRGFSLKYTYEVNGIIYEGTSLTDFYQTSFKKFKGKKFLVAYSRKHPQYSLLLLYPYDYEKFNIPFPDTLSWILNCK